MGIAVKLKKTFLIFSIVLFMSGCEKKETPDVGMIEDDKGFAEDKNGEMIFYDLKKPTIEAKVEVLEESKEDISKLLFNDLKDKVNLIDKISIKDERKLSHITIKLNKVSEVGDGYLDQVKLQFPIVLREISNRFTSKYVSVSIFQVFGDGSSLTMNFKGSDFSNVNFDNLFYKMAISNKDVNGDAQNLLNKICDSSVSVNGEYNFCKKDEAEAHLNRNRQTNTMSKQDSVDKIVSENTESTTLKKDSGLSEHQKKILKDAGFEITLNE